MIWARHLNLFTKVGVAALALGAFATRGSAHNAYQGKFTLPFETHWGGATLPQAITLLLWHPRALRTNFTSMDRQAMSSS